MRNTFVLPLIAALLAAFILSSCSNDASTGPIIDMHMHMYQWNKYGDPPEPNLITGKIPAARTDNQAIDAYLAEMKRYNIVLAVGSGELDTVAKWLKRAPNRFIGGVEFPKFTAPVYQRREVWPDAEELSALYTSDKLGLVGEISAQYAGAALNDPRLDTYFAMAAKLGVPVSVHSGFGPPMSPYRGDPDFRMRYGDPLLLEDVLVKYPHLRVYIAHGGYPFLDHTIALMMQYQQVYVDISAIDWLLTEAEFRHYLQRLVQARLGKRILFGTDQMIWPDAVGRAIRAVESADFLTKDQKRAIFFDNAVRFLRLDADTVLAASKSGGSPSATKVVQVIRSPIVLRPKKPGATAEASVDLDLQGVASSAIRVTGFDIDGVKEVAMSINGHEIRLPPEIVADMSERTVTIELEPGVLKQGPNTVSFLFAEAVGGTTGFSIHDLKILLRKAEQKPTEAAATEG
jgi:predicted TIM-barrel fold metal-dependent hydrolase